MGLKQLLRLGISTRQPLSGVANDLNVDGEHAYENATISLGQVPIARYPLRRQVTLPKKWQGSIQMTH